MFRKRTLFILGAGASHEFRLPLGPGLASTIARSMNARFEHGALAESDGAALMAAVIQNRASEVPQYRVAFDVIRHGVQLASSIDDFLDVHAQDERIQRVGRMAIVKSVLDAERQSTLFLDRSNSQTHFSITEFEDTWIVKFVRMLMKGLAKERKLELFANVAFIVFNYDRCLEHSLFHAVQQVYGVDEMTAAAILDKLTIIHPYGMAAPFRATFGGAGYLFGAAQRTLLPEYWKLAEGVRTYTEQVKDESELDKIRTEMKRAERIVFLGFGFHDQNMRLLAPAGGLEMKQIFATAKGMSESDVGLLTAQLQRFYRTELQHVAGAGGTIVVRSDLTCSQLFDAYNKSLPA